MSDDRDPWTGVGEEFAALGRLFKDRFDAARSGEETQEVEDALHRLAEAAQRVGDAVGETVRDPAFRASATRAAESLRGALEHTFSELGGELGSLFRRGDGER